MKELKAQTRASNKWQEKTGMVSKSYKLKEDTVKAFAEVCEKRGKTQSEVLTELMMAYITGKTSKQSAFAFFFRKK